MAYYSEDELFKISLSAEVLYVTDRTLFFLM